MEKNLLKVLDKKQAKGSKLWIKRENENAQSVK